METFSDTKMNKADFIQSFKTTDIRKEYKFIKKIGSGTSGVYYKARHKVSEDLFAVKAVAKKKCANYE
jgi:serine/threonine protein kinase